MSKTQLVIISKKSLLLNVCIRLFYINPLIRHSETSYFRGSILVTADAEKISGCVGIDIFSS